MEVVQRYTLQRLRRELMNRYRYAAFHELPDDEHAIVMDQCRMLRHAIERVVADIAATRRGPDESIEEAATSVAEEATTEATEEHATDTSDQCADSSDEDASVVDEHVRAVRASWTPYTVSDSSQESLDDDNESVLSQA